MTTPSQAPPNNTLLRTLARICRSAVLGDQTAEDLPSQSEPWDAVWELAEEEDVVSWCFEFVGRHPETIDANRLASWQRNYFATSAKNQAALNQLTEIISSCRDAGIPLIALKGAALLLWLYEDPGSRSLSDIDLLVQEKDALKAECVLEKLGYAIPPAHKRFSNPEVWFHLARMEGGHLPTFIRDDAYPVELHLDFMRKHGSWLLAKDEVWRDTVTFDCGGVQVACLPAEQAFLHAAVHYGHHLADGEAQLSMLVDAAVMVTRKDLLNWSAMWEMAERWQVTYDLHAMLTALKETLDLDAPMPPDIAISRKPMEGTSPFHRLLGMPTIGLKLSYLKGSILPPPTYMRDVFRLSDGRWPLCKAYAHLYAHRFQDAVRRVKRSLGG